MSNIPPPNNHPFESDAAALDAWRDAIALAKNGRYAEALAIFTSLSDQGYLGAAYIVGWLYEKSENEFPDNMELAEKWYERAVAENGEQECRFHLAKMILRRGPADNPDPIARQEYATHLLRDLSAEGYVRADIFLGCMYLEGDVVEHDLDKAEAFFLKAADAGYAIAFALLGRLSSRKRRYLKFLNYTLLASIHTLKLYFKDRQDDRLFMITQGD